MNPRKLTLIAALLAVFLSAILSGCQSTTLPAETEPPAAAEPTLTPTFGGPTATPLPSRPKYLPGEVVDYTAQSGDTLPALAARFNTSVAEIQAANPVIPVNATTMPPGLPMQIPIYYRSFWGTPYQIIPDSLYVNGPAAVEFDTAAFTAQYSGWINRYEEYAADRNRTGPELIDLVAANYSISPQMLLAMSEYLAGALTVPTLPESSSAYPLRFRSPLNQGYYRQLLWAANQFNDGYYKWRAGSLLELELPDSTLERPDPWQNAATVSLQLFFSQIMPVDQYRLAISPEGFGKTWEKLYGSPWPEAEPHIPGSLSQPGLVLPYQAGEVWAYTGGPHTAWGSGEPAAAIDFAPSSDVSGCYHSNEWATAMADGIIIRSESGIVTLDLDMDGDERTGWVLFYLHIESRDRIAAGSQVSAGEILGHPSCEGGRATGTHVHIARKFNGEWILADSVVPFVLEGWRVRGGGNFYEGTLERFEKVVNASEGATLDTNLRATGNVDGKPTEVVPTPTP